MTIQEGIESETIYIYIYIYDKLGIAQIEEKACPTPVEIVWTCPTKIFRGTSV
jgi:hypothetical protein